MKVLYELAYPYPALCGMLLRTETLMNQWAANELHRKH